MIKGMRGLPTACCNGRSPSYDCCEAASLSRALLQLLEEALAKSPERRWDARGSVRATYPMFSIVAKLLVLLVLTITFF